MVPVLNCGLQKFLMEVARRREEGEGKRKKKIKAWKVSLMRLSFSFIKDHVALPSWPGLKIRK